MQGKTLQAAHDAVYEGSRGSRAHARLACLNRHFSNTAPGRHAQVHMLMHPYTLPIHSHAYNPAISALPTFMHTDLSIALEHKPLIMRVLQPRTPIHACPSNSTFRDAFLSTAAPSNALNLREDFRKPMVWRVGTGRRSSCCLYP